MLAKLRHGLIAETKTPLFCCEYHLGAVFYMNIGVVARAHHAAPGVELSTPETDALWYTSSITEV